MGRTQSKRADQSLGSTLAITDDSGSVIQTYTYDAWGNVTHTYGTTTDNPYQYVGQLGYYTHCQESTINLLQLGVRYYDPSTGRFTQQDPIGDGLNWYAYTRNNPLNASDPTGLSEERFQWENFKPHGFGVQYNAEACAGFGWGAGATGSAGGGVFWDRSILDVHDWEIAAHASASGFLPGPPRMVWRFSAVLALAHSFTSPTHVLRRK